MGPSRSVVGTTVLPRLAFTLLRFPTVTEAARVLVSTTLVLIAVPERRGRWRKDDR
jgi:hypothetical protein